MIPDPATRSVLGVWTLDPLTTVVLAALLVVVVAGGRRAVSWSWWRLLPLVSGVALALIAVDAWPGVYARALASVLVSQQLALLLVCPVLVVFGRPAEPLRALGIRVPRLGPFEHPLVGPLVVPLVTAALYFSPLLHLAVVSRTGADVLHLALLAVGAVCAAPLARSDPGSSSLAVGLALFVGIGELLLDAVPGIVLRLSTHVMGPVDVLASRRTWGPSTLHDQQLGGAILWAVAELVDLPYLLIVLRQWIRADAREASALDAELDREALERRVRTPVALDEQPDDGLDKPWWERDASVFGDRAEKFRRRD